MIYFAYGSNLDRVQMAQRCPNARLIGPAQLADHRLCFPRRSPVRGCAVASVEPHAGGVVWGVMYELDADDLARLDAREGYDPVNPLALNRYARIEVVVDRLRGDSVEAVTYVALPETNPGLPSGDYMKHIIEGAAAHSFPDDYVAMLKAVPVTEVA
jgi:gamma-glutamylcyclotransferase